MKIQQMRIRYMNDNTAYIHVPGEYDYYVRNIEEVKSAKDEFYNLLIRGKKDSNDWEPVLEAMMKFQKILFPDNQKLFELGQILNTRYITINADSKIKYFLDIPWELLKQNGRLWGCNYVFQRKSSDMDTGSGISLNIIDKPVVGVIKYNNMPLIEQIKDCLYDLDEKNLIYRPCQISGQTKSECLESITNDVKELHIVHLSCLLLKFRYSEKAYLIFADEFLLSVDDIKNIRLNQKKPIVIFDVTDNSDLIVHIEHKNEFLSNIIKWGSTAVITNICSVPKDFSTEFYCDLHKNLTQNKPLSICEALYKVRKSNFDKNPFVLFFWLYGNSKLPLIQADINQLSDILNRHTDDFAIMDRWIDRLKNVISELKVDSHNDVEGSSKADKFFYLLRKIKCYGKDILKQSVDLFVELRPSDTNLIDEVTRWKENYL